MGLINLQTNLKSLKFGNDRVHGGSSKQPYIQTPIPEQLGDFGALDTDFLLRGGSRAVTDSVKDVERLGKYFTDVRNPSGLLFVAKQNLLSRTAVRTQASGILNEGIYTPLSTLIEAGGVAFGLHVNKQGLNPFNGPGSLITYEDVVNPELGEVFSIKNVNKNRLIDFYKSTLNPTPFTIGKPQTAFNSDLNLYSYTGGPGSILGIGKTYIKKVTNTNEGLQASSPQASDGGIKVSLSKENINLTRHVRASEKYEFYINSSFDPLIDNGFSRSGKLERKYGPLDNNISVINPELPKNDTYNTYSQKQLIDIPESNDNGESFYVGSKGVTTPGDFRKKLRIPQSLKDDKTIGLLPESPKYSGTDAKNIEQRVNLGDPGNRSEKNLTSYTNGSFKGAASNSGNGSYDKINRSPIVLTKGLDSNTKFDEDKNDLVKFAISVLDTKQNNVKSLHFRAFLNQISDQYSADWNPTRYIGRGENFYTYAGFDRKVSLSWTVAAQSKIELIPMYKKLNYLASICAPNYSENGYMQGNIVKLTVGGYFFQQPGIITGFSYEMNDDNATWEIGIDDNGEYDSSVKELPHLIKVSGFNFIPIHDFVPRLVQNPNVGTKERYIALQAGTSNYDVADE